MRLTSLIISGIVCVGTLMGLAASAQAASYFVYRPSRTGPTYSSFADSPFFSQSFSYFYLEDFEDGALNTPGVTTHQSWYVKGPSASTDSVDADDGVVDGAQAARFDVDHGS